MPASVTHHEYVLAINVVGVAPVVISAATILENAVKIIALPTAAGLKIFCPKPPKASFPKIVQRTAATATAYQCVLTDTISAKITPVIQGNDPFKYETTSFLMTNAQTISVSIQPPSDATMISTA